jgi:phosphatidylglycerol---prolipoprotein diacylglyceryl transferase
LGVITAMWWFARKTQNRFLTVTDFIAPLVPIGLGAGRVGNFINAELWGRTTDVPWAIIFPNAGALPRHPSQLYEFVLEGILLFTILWLFSRQPRPTGSVSGLFLLCYGSFRFVVEYFREPDQHLGLINGMISRGQILSMPMVIGGLALIIWAYRRTNDATPAKMAAKPKKS